MLKLGNGRPYEVIFLVPPIQVLWRIFTVPLTGAIPAGIPFPGNKSNHQNVSFQVCFVFLHLDCQRQVKNLLRERNYWPTFMGKNNWNNERRIRGSVKNSEEKRKLKESRI